MTACVGPHGAGR